MYHRVAEENVDPWSLCVKQQHFAEQMEVLRREAHPISLRQLVQAHKEGRIPDRAVAVTFDDGYADNFHSAKPLLEQYNIPATVFVASGYVGHEREFWWDELERVLLHPGTLPKMLTLNIRGKAYEWDLGEVATYSEEEYRRHVNSIIDWEGNSSVRHSLYLSIYKLLQPLLENERQNVMDDLWQKSGATPVRRQTHRALSNEELRILNQGELIEIGSHTVTHPLLPALSVSQQQDEIQRSKSTLEEMIGQRVTSFAYPYGNYKRDAVTIARETEFDCACSTIVGPVWRRSDPFQLPRVTVENWDGEEFLKWLSPMLSHNKFV
jgi:peptidoglycan/xylan/chitin deacetylase (PgdA/CDA1 family)